MVVVQVVEHVRRPLWRHPRRISRCSVALVSAFRFAISLHPISLYLFNAHRAFLSRDGYVFHPGSCSHRMVP